MSAIFASVCYSSLQASGKSKWNETEQDMVQSPERDVERGNDLRVSWQEEAIVLKQKTLISSTMYLTSILLTISWHP